MAASASAGVLGVEVIAAQDVMFEKRMSMIVSIMTLLSSQLIGYGIAGLLRPILVYPAEIIYPGVLPVVALFQSMSSQSQTTVKQMTFFKKAISAISLYEIIPTYLAPALSAVSIWCLTLPKVPAITNLFGGSLPAEGMGLMAFSGDWTLVGSHSPLFVPLLAQMTDWLAYFGCIVIYSGAYTANWFSACLDKSLSSQNDLVNFHFDRWRPSSLHFVQHFRQEWSQIQLDRRRDEKRNRECQRHRATGPAILLH
ncbi:hypothetical protein PGTUg99_020790 [Puccinia graminis f. sp. tritici]|uniref:Uncharacterized protein n=1 Tax=Puccinia graminis f. sp. tritici TaxID=56615 RepID=A0A5B0S556_PUCGR|nr:hypothetical protein PGTUg99_020790 [Puccinia graminis f. sp. tritici]